MAVPVLGDAEVGHRAFGGIKLGQVTAAGLAVKDGDDLHRGLLGLGDVRVAGAGVTDDADVFVKVDRVHLGELAHAGDDLQDTHGHGDLDVALDRAGGSLLDEHGESGDQHGVELAGHALGKAVIVGSDEAQLLVLDPLLEGDHILCHIPDLFDGAAALDIEGVQNVLRLGADRFFIGDIVGDGPHLLPVKLLGVEPHTVVEVGLVDIQIHHAGIGAADLRKVRIAEAAANLRGTAPVGNLGVHFGVAALDDAGDHGVALASALQVGHHLANCAAGIELAQPGGGIGVGIIGGFLLLQVNQHHGHIQIADGGEHVVRGRVGQQLQDDQVHVGGTELVAGFHGLLLGGHKTAVDELHRVGDALFEVCVLCLKLRHQGRELGQIGAQRDGENADSRFGVD